MCLIQDHLNERTQFKRSLIPVMLFADRNSVRLYFLLPDNEHIGDFLRLGLTYFVTNFFASIIQIGTNIMT